jgi:hypothetical protein
MSGVIESEVIEAVASGVAFFLAVFLLIYGAVRGCTDVWSTALLQGPLFVLSLYFIFYGIWWASSGSAGWLILAIIATLYALFSGFVLYLWVVEGPGQRDVERAQHAARVKRAMETDRQD